LTRISYHARLAGESPEDRTKSDAATRPRRSAYLLIDAEEDRVLRAVLVGVLREVGRGLRPCKPKGRTSAGEGRTALAPDRGFLVCVAVVLMSATVGVGIAQAAAVDAA